jgi:predicted transcriptional regulator
LGIKRGFIKKDAKGAVMLTENGISMVEAVIEEEAAKS